MLRISFPRLMMTKSKCIGWFPTINLYRAAAVRVHGIGGTLIDKGQNIPVKPLGSFTMAVPLAVTDDASGRPVQQIQRVLNFRRVNVSFLTLQNCGVENGEGF